jgi:folate-binding protein YgfZ
MATLWKTTWKYMSRQWELARLEDMGVLRLRGPDSVRFLQGQLSNDVTRINHEHSELAGYHNPQGRTIALLRLVCVEDGDLLAICPREILAAVTTRLSKFILRAKVKISDDSANWLLQGLTAREAVEEGCGLSLQRDSQTRLDDSLFVCIGSAPPRWLVISASDRTSSLPATALRDPVPADRESWRLLDIAAGLPQVYAVTSEEFVAQMLNLDLLDAIAFDKGCYTGQEVIARTHYRGRVKRRMQHFVSREPARLTAGDSIQLAGRTVKVVEAAQRADGRCEFLAVAPLVTGEAEAGEPGEGGNLDAEQLTLPYALPDL